MSLSTIASVLQPTPQTNSDELVSGLETLVRSGQQNEANLAQQLSRPLPSDLRPSGTGITISATV
jgi:hypothetical protein